MGVTTKIVRPKLEATVGGHIHRKANDHHMLGLGSGMPPPGQRGAASGYGGSAGGRGPSSIYGW